MLLLDRYVRSATITYCFFLYREEEKEAGPPFTGSARLCFSLRYDDFSEELMVCLIRATRLSPIGENVTVTPYVKIFLLPDKRRKVQSRVLRRTSNPIFFEDFIFMVPPDDLPNRTLEFTVCEFDRFSRQQVIGHVTYPLKGVNVSTLPQGTGEIWVDIKSEDFKVGSVIKDDFQSVLRSLSTLMFINIISLTRWNENRCYSLRTIYLIFEFFQILFLTASSIFTAEKLFH